MNIIRAHGVPTTSTVGEVGQRYIDLDTDIKYECTEIQTKEIHGEGPCIHNDFVAVKYLKNVYNEYTWTEVASSGGGGSVFDFVVNRDDTGNLLINGDYASIVEKVNAGLPVFAVYRRGDNSNHEYFYLYEDNSLGYYSAD